MGTRVDDEDNDVDNWKIIDTILPLPLYSHNGNHVSLPVACGRDKFFTAKYLVNYFIREARLAYPCSPP